ncbi:MAG: hypothetical protein JNL57_12785 [Bacteroidetes bacterium]|nr:hypothetical protein [Bacteroidota bacterium]
MKDQINLFNKYLTQFINQQDVEITDSDSDFYPTDNWNSLPENLQELYHHITRIKIRWHFKEEGAFGRVEGSVHILECNAVAGSWENIVWFGYPGEDSTLQKFRIVDYFSNENFVGYFENDSGNNELYYCSPGGPFYSLKIGLKGYITLLTYTMGMLNWQRSLVQLNSGIAFPETEILKQNISRFPANIAYSDFVQEYNKLKQF